MAMSISAAIKESRSNVSMNAFGNQYTVGVYSEAHRAIMQSGAMDYHNARRSASRNVVAGALELLGVDQEEAAGYAYSTDGYGTISDRVKSYFAKAAK